MENERNGTGTARPLDVLGNSLEKTILVKTKHGEDITGQLKAFDSHINVWLDDARVNGEKEIRLGTVLIRGDSIVYISPGK
ncbi:MAG: RNA-binding protein [Nanoarchaeota archaeon]|nr:RNA-binding protein [Nanoarchaeota archaeon]